jgi:hypothetical protein
MPKSAGSLLMREKKTVGKKERLEFDFDDNDEEAMAAYG